MREHSCTDVGSRQFWLDMLLCMAGWSERGMLLRCVPLVLLLLVMMAGWLHPCILSIPGGAPLQPHCAGAAACYYPGGGEGAWPLLSSWFEFPRVSVPQ